jgi:hypothetical protein
MKWKATLDYNSNSYENKIIKSATHFERTNLEPENTLFGLTLQKIRI